MQAGPPSASSSAHLPSGVAYEYANYFEAGFSREEILLRFAQAYDGHDSLTDRARIVMTPSYARALLLLLQSTLARFEAVHEALHHTGGIHPAAASATGQPVASASAGTAGSDDAPQEPPHG